MKFLLAFVLGGAVGGALAVGLVAVLPGGNDPITSVWDIIYPFVLGMAGVILGNIAGAKFADKRGWTL